MLNDAILLFALLSVILTVFAETDRVNPSTYSFTVGKFNATVVLDGPIIFDQDALLVPESSRLRALKENFRSIEPGAQTLFDLSFLLVDTPTNRILIDTGGINLPEFDAMGMFAEAGKLFENLQAAGVSRESIDTVIISHGHTDHIGGLTQRGDDSISFPNADVYITRIEHEFWISDDIPAEDLDPEFRDDNSRAYRRSVKPYQDSGRLNLVEFFSTPVEGMTLLPCIGHSLGQACIKVTSEGESIIYAADVFRTKWDQVQNPEWALAIDANRSLAIESRVSFFEQYHDNMLLVASHEKFPSVGYIRKLGPFYDWIDADSTHLGTVSRVEV